MRWRNEIRAFTSKLTKLIAHIIFPSSMTRASSQLIYAAYFTFLLKFKKELKNTTTLIFCMYIGLSSCTIYGSSCCLLVVVKGDVDCKAMFNVVSVCATLIHEIHYTFAQSQFKLRKRIIVDYITNWKMFQRWEFSMLFWFHLSIFWLTFKTNLWFWFQCSWKNKRHNYFSFLLPVFLIF